MMRCVPDRLLSWQQISLCLCSFCSTHNSDTVFFVDTQGESYARPTALFSPDSASLDRDTRIAPIADPSFAIASNPSAFSALSSVAVEELYALEREEALRRAEFEIRHQEALRRAEYEARHAEILSMHGRLSKSASTTPMMTPFYPPHQVEEGGYFGISRERERDVEPAPALSRGHDQDVPAPVHHGRKHVRRLSASSARREQLGAQLHSTGHVVGHPHTHGHGHSAWPHPYHLPSHSHPHSHSHAYSHSSHRHVMHGSALAHQHADDCPSPVSSDSDSLQPTHSPTRSAAFHVPLAQPVSGYPASVLDTHGGPVYANGGASARLPGSDFNFTPSTSPFLGGMRRLNIHSAVPSRAPSPFHLPPALTDEHETKLPPSASPPTATLPSPQRNSTGDLVSLMHPAGAGGVGLYQPYSSERGLANLSTPQLSSGPSSSGSSPRSHTNSLSGSGSGHGGGSGSGSLSAASSRAPSPPLWAQQQQHYVKSPTALPYHRERERERDHPHHHHLAHSVRAAFGMTPIHPRGRPAAPPFASASLRGAGPDVPLSVHFNLSHDRAEGVDSHSPSVPGSRASSPPIKLAPLKLASLPSSPMHRPTAIVGVKDLLNLEEPAVPETSVPERVELPRFSEIEAATGLR